MLENIYISPNLQFLINYNVVEANVHIVTEEPQRVVGVDPTYTQYAYNSCGRTMLTCKPLFFSASRVSTMGIWHARQPTTAVH